MTLDEMLLQRLAEWEPAAGRQTLNLPDADGGWRFSLTADRSDSLGCLVWEMTLRRTNPPVAEVGALKVWAEEFASRAMGLLEALKVVEVDTIRMEALVRSDEPSRRDAKVAYYEIILRGNQEVNVRRYQGALEPGVRREQVAFTATHETLAKLVRNLTSSR